MQRKVRLINVTKTPFQLNHLCQAIALSMATLAMVGCGGGGSESGSSELGASKQQVQDPAATKLSTETPALLEAEAQTGSSEVDSAYSVLVEPEASPDASRSQVRFAPLAATVAESTVVVRARAMLANNVGANMVIRVNGTVIGTVEVRSETFTSYTFKTTQTVGLNTKVDVVFTNDVYDPSTTPPADRNLLVESIDVNGKLVLPTAAGVVYDLGSGDRAFDGLDTRPGRVGLGENGAMRFVLDAPQPAAPQPTSQKLTVRAKGQLAGGVAPKMSVYVDRALVGTATVDSVTAFTSYLFDTSATITPTTRVDVVYSNDYNPLPPAGQDRNLLIESINLAGKTIASTDASVVYDKGEGDAAFDGLNTMPGRQGMPENGAMRFVMGGGTVVTPPTTPPGGTVGALKGTDPRVKMVYDPDKTIPSQPSYLTFYAGANSSSNTPHSQGHGLINKIPEGGMRVDADPAHLALQRVFSSAIGGNAFQTTVSDRYPRTPENTSRFTPGGAYSMDAGPGKEVWCAYSFVPTNAGADYGGLTGLHHWNVPGIGLTPWTIAVIPKGNGTSQFQLFARSTTTVNGSTWNIAPRDGGTVNIHTNKLFGTLSPYEHHKVVVHFRINYAKDPNAMPFIDVYHKVGNTWQGNGAPVVSVRNLPIGHNLTDQRHQLRPTGIYNWQPNNQASWPAVNNVPKAGEKGLRSLSRGGICAVAGAPQAGEPALNKDSLMGWLERP